MDARSLVTAKFPPQSAQIPTARGPPGVQRFNRERERLHRDAFIQRKHQRQKKCDDEAAATPSTLHFLVIPLSPGAGDLSRWQRRSLNDVGNALALSADEALSALSSGGLKISKKDGRSPLASSRFRDSRYTGGSSTYRRTKNTKTAGAMPNINNARHAVAAGKNVKKMA